MRRLDLLLAENTFVRRLVAVDRRTYEITFSLIIILVLGVVITESLSYDWDAGIVPLIVSVPAFVIMIAVLTSLVYPNVDLRLGRRETTSRLDALHQSDEEPAGHEDQGADPQYKLVAFLVWLAALYVVLLLFGFTAGSLVFLILFYRNQAEQDWKRTIGYSLMIWLFVIALFIFVLNTRMYDGLIIDYLT